MATATAAAGYFVDNKKGEVNELRTLLRNPDIQKDAKRHRQLLQRVISYMTLGIDVSRLHPEMIMATATKDVVQKKLAYLYLCNYAEANSELTLLVINTLQKDCRDENPMIRGLALRNMCALRTPSLLEYVLIPLKAGLRDKSSYVRKTAAMGALQIFYLNKNVVKTEGIVDALRELLRDRDQQVVANSISSLSEILASEGGLQVDTQLAHYLLNRIKDFSEWNQASVLGLLSKYTPQNEDEVFDILNILEERVKHANAAIVMAAAKLFLQYTEKIEEVRGDVYQRLKSPFLTLIGSSSPEIVFVALQHVQLMLHREPSLFDAEVAQFFCRYNDPSYVKFLRLDILTEICKEQHFAQIVEELSAYVTDVDVDMARASIRSLGKMAIKVPSCARATIATLVSFLDLDIDYVSGETMSVMKDLLRKYKEHVDEVLPRLKSHMANVHEHGAKASMVWMLGEYGESIPESPYLLEPLIMNITEEESAEVRLQLLTATMKLFLKRAPECQAMLGRLLEHEVSDETHMDVHDRAMLYYRLLKEGGIDLTQRVVGSQHIYSNFSDEQKDLILSDRVFEEFNTLSVVYQAPSETFISQVPPYITAASWDGPSVDMRASSSIAVAQSVGTVGQNEREHPSSGNNNLIPDLMGDDIPSPQQAKQSFSLIDEFDLAPGIQLNPQPILDAPSFERKWVSRDIFSSNISLQLSTVPSLAQMEACMERNFVKTMASSEQPDLLKFYVYAQERYSGAFFLVEATASRHQRKLDLLIKAEEPTMLQSFIEHIKRALTGQFM